MHQEQARQAELQTLWAKEQESQAEVRTLQAEVQTLRAKEQESQAEVQTLQAELQTLRATMHASQAELQASRAEVQTQQAALARLRVRPKKGNRAGTMAPATRALFRAAGAVLYGENRNMIPRTQQDLANLVVERAYDLGLAPDDMLNANEKNVLVAAQELLAGMRAADLEDS
jgi:chromosome segregation ATPase